MEVAEEDDDLLSFDNDEGISMVIGSDNEEELLQLSSTELDTNKLDEQVVIEDSEATLTKHPVSNSVTHDSREKDCDSDSKSTTVKPQLPLDHNDQNSSESNKAPDNVGETKETDCQVRSELLDSGESSKENPSDNSQSDALNQIKPSEENIPLVIEVDKSVRGIVEFDNLNETTAAKSCVSKNDIVKLNTSSDDDDVIFEGITKCGVKTLETEKENDKAITNSKSMASTDVSQVADSKVDEKNEVKPDVKKDLEEHDDDVILEKVVKPVEFQSKQNCDKTNVQVKCEDTINIKGETTKYQRELDNESRDQTPRKRPGDSLVNVLERQMSKRSKLDVNGVSVKSNKMEVPESIELSDSEDNDATSESKQVTNDVDSKDRVKEKCTLRPIECVNGRKLITLTEQVNTCLYIL